MEAKINPGGVQWRWSMTHGYTCEALHGKREEREIRT